MMRNIILWILTMQVFSSAVFGQNRLDVFGFFQINFMNYHTKEKLENESFNLNLKK